MLGNPEDPYTLSRRAPVSRAAAPPSALVAPPALVLAAALCALALLGAPACAESTTGAADAGIDGSDALRACAVNSDCVVVPVSCCGTCGTATRGDAIAIARARAGEFRSGACGAGSVCPPCAGTQDPSLLATCQAGRCALVDLLDVPSNACTADADCRVRSVDCCECGGRTGRDGLVAIRVDAEPAFSALVCDGPTVACPECAPVYPSEARAVCDPRARHCALVWER